MGALNTIMNTLKVDQPLPQIGLNRDRSQPSPDLTTKARRGSTTVGRLLKAIGHLPPHSLLLGEYADGLPFIIELGDPEMGAILVSCEKGAGKTHQLQVLADSAIRLNAPNDVQLGILTFKPNEWQIWQLASERKRFVQGIFAWYDPWAENLIQNIVELAEARRDGKRLGADVLLILDDLNFIEELSFEAQVNLHWLLEYGSQSGIWIIGAINAHQVTHFRYWVDTFRLRIIGWVVSAENAETLGVHAGSKARHLEPGTFCTWTGDDWRTHRLPLLGD